MITLSEMSARAAAPGAKVSVTVERLLQWAYAEQLVHASRPEGMPADLVGAASGVLRHKTMFDVSALGTYVNSSANCGFEAPADAYLVDEAVRRLPDLEIVLPPACYGMAVVRGIIPEVETRFRLSLSALVFEWAWRRGRPDWVMEPSLVMEKGHALKGVDARRRKIVVMYTVRSVGDKPWEVERARMIYSAWADALERVRASVADRLDRFVLAVDSVDRAPWATRR